jgi:hypothetical protein
MPSLRARRPGPRQGARPQGSRGSRGRGRARRRRGHPSDRPESSRRRSPTRRARASASARHTPGRPAARSRLAGRSSPPWAPGPRVRRPRRTRNFVVDAAPARSWAPTWSATGSTRWSRRWRSRAAVRSSSGSSTHIRLLGGDPRRGPGDRRLGDPHLARRARSARCKSTPGPRRSLSRRMARRFRAGGPTVSLRPDTRLASSARWRASCRKPGVDRGVSAGP